MHARPPNEDAQPNGTRIAPIAALGLAAALIAASGLYGMSVSGLDGVAGPAVTASAASAPETGARSPEGAGSARSDAPRTGRAPSVATPTRALRRPTLASGPATASSLPRPTAAPTGPDGVALGDTSGTAAPDVSARRRAALAPTAGATTAGGSPDPRRAVPTASVAAWAAADGPVIAPAPYFTFSRPFDTSLDVRTSRYYPYGTTAGGEYLLHHGVDIGNAFGSIVRATADGEVVYAGGDAVEAWGPRTDFYGRIVVLRHDAALGGRPLFSLYGHVSRELVSVGRKVLGGEPIAEVGSGGVALGPHLHLEIRFDAPDYGSTLNPDLLLEMLPGHGVIVGRLKDGAGRPVTDTVIGLYGLVGDRPGEWLGQTTTYPANHVNSAPGWQENFVLADTPAGDYWLGADVRGERVGAPVTLGTGSAVLVTLSPN